MVAYAFRQAAGEGTLTVDDLKVGTAFDAVFPVTTPVQEPLTIQFVDQNVILSWTNSAFSLQSAPTVTGPYSTISGATSPYTNSASSDQQYFRLKY